ncbi:MAG: hypothetical protein MI864_11590 [Pseudomonadales bacterium]|nr:hypothetical protein [Pseudomonadales bacterium]
MQFIQFSDQSAQSQKYLHRNPSNRNLQHYLPAVVLVFSCLSPAATAAFRDDGRAILEQNESYTAQSGEAVYGSSGQETVLIEEGVTVTLDGNIERVELPGQLSDYQWAIAGTRTTLQQNNTSIVQLLGQNNPTTFVFSDGAASLALSGLNQASLNGVELSATASTLSVTLDENDVSSTVPSNTALNAPKVTGITTTFPDSLANTYQSQFNRYTSVLADNGEAIHIVAQSSLSEGQIIRARNVLVHFLTDYSGSTYGSDKTDITRKMAENGATLLLLNGRDDGSNSAAELDGQPLYEEEIQVEGDTRYINQQYDDHRDATYEEILHMVHDYGIGIDGDNSLPGVRPNYQAEIRSAQTNALSSGLWGIDAEDWIAELQAENSLTQEYLAAVIDVYYGLWGAWTESNDTGMWGLYRAKVRADIATNDPQGQSLLENRFFHPWLTYDAQIDSSFSGTFYLRFDNSMPYTHHAQYLKDITFTGSNNTQVIVNAFDNNITGNTGTNTVHFSGASSEYSITTISGVTRVNDTVSNRDGQNTLTGIEILKFTDISVAIQ